MTQGVATIRSEARGDWAEVFGIQAAAFGRDDEARLVDALRDRARPFLSLVAERDGRLVGHVAFSPVTLEPADDAPPLGGLAPVAVAPDAQGRGVGGALVRAGLARAGALGWRAVFLVGSPAYYARFGFVAAAPLGFTYGNPALDAALQAFALRPGALAGLGGRVAFHPAFAELGLG